MKSRISKFKFRITGNRQPATGNCFSGNRQPATGNCFSGNYQRGTVMILVIWIVLVLTVVAYSLAYEIRIGMKMTMQGSKRIKAQGLAKVGLARAVTDLRNDRLLALADSGRNSDTLGDIWANVEDKIDVKEGGGTYSVIVLDEERKINVNTLSMGSAGVISYLLTDVLDLKEDVALNIANAIIDYKDPDLIPSGGQGSDEINYYTETAQKLLRKTVSPDWIFRPRNDQIMTINELLEIPGITPDVLYGTAETANADPFEVAQEKRRKASKALADYVTVESEGAVNINTCSMEIIKALLCGVSKNKENAKWADKIDKIRKELLRKRSQEGYGINNMAQFVTEGVPPDVVATLDRAVPLCTSSIVFKIIARGEYDGVRSTTCATVQISIEPFSLDQMSKQYQRKRDPAAMGVLSSQPNLVIDPAVRVIAMSEY